MDFFLPIIIFLLLFIIFSICGYCCKRKRDGVVYGYGGTGVTVTTASPVVIPPYPVDARHPTPQICPPAPPGFVPSQTMPPTSQPTHMMYPPPTGAAPVPYPPTQAPYPPTSAPYPTATPYPATNMAPYPPQQSAMPPYHVEPPSYSEAISQPPVPPPQAKEGYVKQAAYNPDFN